MRRRTAAAALALLVVSLVPAVAQNELDSLFAQLRDPAAGSEVLRIESRIWDAWMHAGTDAENEALAKASASMNAGDGQGALKQLDALVASSPGFPEAWNKRATLYFLLGRYDESLADIEKVLDLEPRHFGALSGRGMIYQRLGRNGEALAAFRDALAVNPHMAGAKLAIQQLEQQAPEL